MIHISGGNYEKAYRFNCRPDNVLGLSFSGRFDHCYVPAPPGTNESDIVSCIFGNNSQGCDASIFAAFWVAWGDGQQPYTRDYTVGEIRALVGNVFRIGIDSNTSPGRPEIQMLTEFTLEVVGGPLLYTLAQTYEINTPVAQGNGFTDYIMSLFDLSGLS